VELKAKCDVTKKRKKKSTHKLDCMYVCLKDFMCLTGSICKLLLMVPVLVCQKGATVPKIQREKIIKFLRTEGDSDELNYLKQVVGVGELQMYSTKLN